jgi:hypothetical protein
LLETRWMAAATTTTTNDSILHHDPTTSNMNHSTSIIMNPALLQSLREYTSRHYYYQTGTPRSNNLRTSSSSSSSYWIPSPNATACDEQSYTIMAPMFDFPRQQGNTSSSIHHFSIRHIVLHVLQWLYDPAVATIYLLLPRTLQAAVTVDLVYGARLMQAWPNVRLVYADTLAEAMATAVAQYQQGAWSNGGGQAKKTAAGSAVLWRNLDEPLPSRLTRAVVSATWHSWRQRPSRAMFYSYHHFPFHFHDDGDASKMSRRHPVNDNAAPVIPDWNGLMHHFDYLCLLVGQEWSRPLFFNSNNKNHSSSSSFVDADTTMWGLVLALGHLSPEPWQLYGPTTAQALLSTSTTTTGVVSFSGGSSSRRRRTSTDGGDVNDRVQNERLGTAAALWGGFPWTVWSFVIAKESVDVCSIEKSPGSTLLRILSRGE